MIVGVDFDRVLFDTDRFNREIKEKTGMHHVEADVYDDNGNYSPEKHADLCGVDPEELYEFVEENASRFLYPDVGRLESIEHELWLVTRGKERFQKAKIRGSGVESLFEKIVVVEKGSKDRGIDFLIDDREEEIENADIDGYCLDRSSETLGDAVEKVKQLET